MGHLSPWSWLLLLGIVILGASPISADVPPSKARLARYAQHLLVENYRANGPGAAMLVARDGSVLFRGARGLADVEHHKPLTPDVLFDIGSITKQFAAAGLLKLAEAGKVSLDDPLSKYVGNYPGGDHITLAELLNHTSGIRSYTELPLPLDQHLTRAQLIERIGREKPDFAPGEAWAYDNSGYLLIGAVIEAASGTPWQRYLQQTLFTPLGLSHTGYGADPEIIASKARGYTLVRGKPVRAPSLSLADPYADGALVSNIDDLLKWNRALHEGRVLRSDLYRRMITPAGKAAGE